MTLVCKEHICTHDFFIVNIIEMENMKNNEYFLKTFYQSPGNIYLFKSTMKTLEKGAKYVQS